MRAYGVTNAAPYASAPAVGLAGDTYWNTTTKLLYVSDGTSWVQTAGPPTGTASGSLAGTYPGPSIAASAVRGTPSSGGTAREISKASIWGGDDLIDISVTRAKLALGATSSNRVGVSIANSFSNVTANTWIKVVDVPSITLRGGIGVFIYASAGGYITVAPAGGTFYQSIGRGGTQLYNLRYELKSPVTANTQMTIPPILFWDTPAAGTYTYSYWVWQGTNVLFVGPASDAGQVWVEEFS